MIQLVPQLRILLARNPVDFRCGIDGLAAICKRELAEDPFSGDLFVFRGAALGRTAAQGNPVIIGEAMTSSPFRNLRVCPCPYRKFHLDDEEPIL
jgi:IS66 Orf2 like protein